jgi:hypothetical protein
MKKEITVSLLWDGFKENYVMFLAEEQKFCKGYFELNKMEFIKRRKNYYYREPGTNKLVTFYWDNFGIGDMQQHKGNTNEIFVSFRYGGIVNKKLWKKWFNTDSAILDKALLEKLRKDKDFIAYKKEQEAEFSSCCMERLIIEYFCKGNRLNET